MNSQKICLCALAIITTSATHSFMAPNLSARITIQALCEHKDTAQAKKIATHFLEEIQHTHDNSPKANELRSWAEKITLMDSRDLENTLADQLSSMNNDFPQMTNESQGLYHVLLYFMRDCWT